MRGWLALLALAGCDSGKVSDCAIVRDRPASAMAELSKRHPDDPVKVAETIERCIAPSGDECDRLAKIIAAMPTLAPQLAMPERAFDAASTCRDAPAELRRCLWPSYVLGHADECHRILTQNRAAIEIEPKGREIDTDAAGDDCGSVAIYLDEHGTWLATGRDPAARCFSPRKTGALDQDWLEAQLRAVKALPCSPSAAELASAGSVTYADVIAAMDVAVKVGFVDVGLSEPAQLSVALASADPHGAKRDCPVSLIAPDPAQTAAAEGTEHAAPVPTTHSALQDAPVVVVTRDQISVQGRAIATIDEARSGTGPLTALVKALPPAKDGLLILQADRSLPAGVINRIVTTAKGAGYDNIMFAVKNK